jgi:hypothetical protein
MKPDNIPPKRLFRKKLAFWHSLYENFVTREGEGFKTSNFLMKIIYERSLSSSSREAYMVLVYVYLGTFESLFWKFSR